MSYTKLTDFAVKDSLLTGNPSKVVRGSEIDAEFNAIATADALNLKSSDATTTYARLGANTDITSLASIASINGGQLAGLRNRIINGTGSVWQRGSVNISSAVQYGPDRWLCSIASGTGISGAIIRNTFTPSSSGYGVFCASTTFTTGQPYFEQRIESANSYGLNSKVVTVSGLLYQDTGSTQNFTIRINKANSIDNFGAVTLISDSSAVSVPSGTVTSFSRTFTLGSSDASNGIAVAAFVSAPITVTNKNFAITDVQIEIGSVATPFEQRPIGLELALCQRYYAKTFAQSTAPAQNTGDFSGIFAVAQVNNAPFSGTWKLPVTMRAVPTIVTYCPNAANANWTTNGATPTANVVIAGTESIAISGTTATTAGNGYYLHASASAEL